MHTGRDGEKEKGAINIVCVCVCVSPYVHLCSAILALQVAYQLLKSYIPVPLLSRDTMV